MRSLNGESFVNRDAFNLGGVDLLFSGGLGVGPLKDGLVDVFGDS